MGDAVTAAAKCESYRLKLLLPMLERVATRMGMVWENKRKVDGATSGDPTTRMAKHGIDRVNCGAFASGKLSCIRRSVFRIMTGKCAISQTALLCQENKMVTHLRLRGKLLQRLCSDHTHCHTHQQSQGMSEHRSILRDWESVYYSAFQESGTKAVFLVVELGILWLEGKV